jgi:hypothetical protein
MTANGQEKLLPYLDVSSQQPALAQSARTLLRAAKIKEPQEAAEKLFQMSALDISRDHWTASGPPMSFGFLKFLPSLTSLKMDFQRHAPDEAVEVVWSRPLRVLSMRGFGTIDCAQLVLRMGPGVLEELDLSECTLENAASLAGLKSLRVLALAKTKLANVDFLASLAALETLDVTENTISRLPDLGGSVGLRSLKLAKNAVEDLTPIAKLRKLKVLDFSENSVSDLTPLEGLREINTLRFGRNRVRTIRSLRNLDMLETTALALNPIAEDEIEEVLRRRVRIE